MQDEYKPPSDGAAPPPAENATTTSAGGNAKVIHSQPSFNFGWQSVMGSVGTGGSTVELKADSPLRVLRDPILLTFILMCFLFHMANGTVLPLVMQTVAIGSGREGILLSGLCIIVAQIFMVLSAKVCGTYSGKHGRKPLFLIGLLSVPVRCLLLTLLLRIRGEDNKDSVLMNCFILSTQVLDGVGAGVFGTMYILVTSDISGGTGRFSMTLGLTTAAMSIGGTVSGYLGEALAQDLGYEQAYFILMFLSMIPAAVYLFFMPETLPALVKAKAAGFGHMESLAEGDEEDHHDTEPKDTSYNQLT
jgi:MFS family permease